MVHIYMLLLGWSAAIGLRLQWRRTNLSTPNPSTPKPWRDRWQRAIVAFVLPPVILFSTALSLLWMGPIGQMSCGWHGWVTYGWAIGFLAIAAGLGLQTAVNAWRSQQQLQTYPLTELALSPLLQSILVAATVPARLIDTTLPFIAQMGLGRSQLVVSPRLLQQLDADHFDAVLLHETAHVHYQDTNWFFGLGWLRRCGSLLPGFVLPNNDALWQELILLREMRADRWAAQNTDPLLLAEALFLVVSEPWASSSSFSIEAIGVALSGELAIAQLNERIDQLLIPAVDEPSGAEWSSQHRSKWLWAIAALLPLFAVPFHH
jgi:Zn-dependent protease with chaperone function